MTVAIWPFEAVPVREQHPSWLDDGHELTLVDPEGQLATALAGTVMQSDMSDVVQLRVLPPELPPEPPPELLLEPGPPSLPPPSVLPPQAMASAGAVTRRRTKAKLREGMQQNDSAR